MTAPEQPEVVVHLVHRYFDRHGKPASWGEERIDAYASRDEAEIIAKLHGETVETVPVIGAMAFTSDELGVIAELLRACDSHTPGEVKRGEAMRQLEIKARTMAELEAQRHAS